MMKILHAIAPAFGLFFIATTAFAGMGKPGMYNVTVAVLAGRDNANGIDEKFRGIDGVQKVHVDYKNGVYGLGEERQDARPETHAENRRKSGF